MREIVSRKIVIKTYNWQDFREMVKITIKSLYYMLQKRIHHRFMPMYY